MRVLFLDVLTRDVSDRYLRRDQLDQFHCNDRSSLAAFLKFSCGVHIVIAMLVREKSRIVFWRRGCRDFGDVDRWRTGMARVMPGGRVFLQAPGPEIIGLSGAPFSLAEAVWMGEKILVGAVRMNEFFSLLEWVECLAILDTQGFRRTVHLKAKKYMDVWTSI